MGCLGGRFPLGDIYDGGHDRISGSEGEGRGGNVLRKNFFFFVLVF